MGALLAPLELASLKGLTTDNDLETFVGLTCTRKEACTSCTICFTSVHYWSRPFWLRRFKTIQKNMAESGRKQSNDNPKTVQKLRKMVRAAIEYDNDIRMLVRRLCGALKEFMIESTPHPRFPFVVQCHIQQRAVRLIRMMRIMLLTARG